MQLTAKQTTAQEAVKAIVSKCWEDVTFRQELVSSPVETLEKYSGHKLNIPAGKELIVVDQTDASKLYLNIHAKPNIDDLELTDEQLELVAGGEWIFIGGIVVGIVVGAIVANL